MSTLHYVAYGSNLHPQQLAARVPSARPLGVVPLPGCRLAFHKRSIDGSGKCLFYLSDDPADIVYGVLYEHRSAEKAALDRLEGAGQGYVEQRFPVSLDGRRYTAYLYAASASHVDASLRPYHWYKQRVAAGARCHRLPHDYVRALEAVASIPDADPGRARQAAAAYDLGPVGAV